MNRYGLAGIPGILANQQLRVGFPLNMYKEGDGESYDEKSNISRV